MKNIKGLLVFSSILVAYGLMFMATSKPCDEECEAQYEAGAHFSTKPYVAYVNIGTIGTNPALIVGVDTSHHKDWNLVADSSCNYLKSVNLVNYKVAIINKSNQIDTLAKANCF